MATSAVSRLNIVSRIAAGVLGGYAFTWGFIALLVGTLFWAQMEFHDAEALGYILGFIVFLVVFLWAFAAASVGRVWLVLAGGGALMTGAAWLVQRAILQAA
ncbi:MAG: iron uptake protein [Comamonadaceae bacterium]|nr:MAG: iron uptake protein [Comamonadaceae bacterium]